MIKETRTLPGSAPEAGGASARLPLHDKQSERDHREIPIDKVGVRGLRMPIQIRTRPYDEKFYDDMGVKTPEKRRADLRKDIADMYGDP